MPEIHVFWQLTFAHQLGAAKKAKGARLPDDLHPSGTLRLLLLPLRLVPVQLVEHHHQRGDQVEVLVHPAGLQDAFGNVPLVGGPLEAPRRSERVPPAARSPPVTQPASPRPPPRLPQAPSHLGAALGVLVVAGQHLEGDGHAVGAAVGAEGVPDGAVHGVVHHVQARQRHEGHGAAAQLHREVPLAAGHPAGVAAAPHGPSQRGPAPLGPSRPRSPPA